MHNRRSVLLSVASLAAVGSGGCTDSEQEAFEEATSLLEQNAETLNTFAERDDVPEQFDAETIKSRADLADEHLDEAEQGMGGEDAELVEYSKGVADYQREAADYNTLLVEFNNCLDTVNSYTDSERFEDADQELDTCDNVLRDVERQLNAVEEAHSALDPNVVDDTEQLQHDRISSSLQVERQGIQLLNQFIDSFQTFMTGSVTFFEALELYQNEKFDRSETQFGVAATDFADSERTLDDLESDDETPEQYRSDIIEFNCYAKSLREASEKFRDSARALQNGNYQQAEADAEEANKALDRCE